MSPLNVKRLVVWVVSQILGFITTFLIISFGFEVILPAVSSIEAGQGVTIAEYGYLYFLVTAVPIGLVFLIWMDRFLDTGILPD